MDFTCRKFPVVDSVTLLALFIFYPFFIDQSIAESYYDLLNVTKYANVREIRQSFKKLALIHHPDKNQDDPKAQEKFLRVKRAYDVLRDENLRRKYDLHGEEGAKEGEEPQQFHSWTFYKEEFGIYDDDPEIVTLSGLDFEQLVLNDGQRWFINFYSAHCSHCHHIAQDWRKMAREVEGAFRIGAVNCLDDYAICNQQGIRSYPSLVVYPERISYEGQRDVDHLVDFILAQLNPRMVQNFNQENYNHWIKNDLDLSKSGNKKPWLVEFFSDGQGFSVNKRKILAASLENLANFAFIDCGTGDGLCESLGFNQQLVYFPAGAVLNSTGVVVNSLDTKEIMKSILQLLPDFVELDDVAFKKVRSDIILGQELPWLIEFFGLTQPNDLDLRKLPALLLDVKVGRLNCSENQDLCLKELKIFNLPSFAVFKKMGGFEIHYGRHTTYDLASFARDCAFTNLRSLGPDQFPAQVVYGSGTWFVDFFAPWCPPCMKLLPEFRKAAKSHGDEINFGTVDCTVHQHLCQSFNVHTYPTTILYNMTKPHVFVGYHSSGELIDFIEDMKNPPVITLVTETFESLVQKRKKDEIWVVDFYNPNCYPCQQLAPEFRKLAKIMGEYEQIHFGHVDCLKFDALCRRQFIHGYPTIRLYPMDKDGYTDYQNWHRDANSLRQWVHGWLPSDVEEIFNEKFLLDVLNSAEPHLVDFFAPWCGHCNIFAPEYEKVAKALKNHVKVVKMNCDLNPAACSAAGVRSYPTVKFYIGRETSREAGAQNPLGLDIFSQRSSDIVEIVEQKLKKLEHSIKRDEL